ncbi:hypothetical protein V3C99_012926 [Haemonchus contortus]
MPIPCIHIPGMTDYHAMTVWRSSRYRRWCTARRQLHFIQQSTLQRFFSVLVDVGTVCPDIVPRAINDVVLAQRFSPKLLYLRILRFSDLFTYYGVRWLNIALPNRPVVLFYSLFIVMLSI